MLAGVHFYDPLSPSLCWDHQLIRKSCFTAGAWKGIPNTSGALSMGKNVGIGTIICNIGEKLKGLGESQTFQPRLSLSPLIQRAWTAGSINPVFLKGNFFPG